MFLGVLVNIGDQNPKMCVIFNPYATKRALKQRTSALVHLVEGTGIGIEQVGKYLTGRFGKWSVFDTNQKVEVVSQQAVGIGLC